MVPSSDGLATTKQCHCVGIQVGGKYHILRMPIKLTSVRLVTEMVIVFEDEACTHVLLLSENVYEIRPDRRPWFRRQQP